MATYAYWGPVTSSTEWCENNYAVSPYIAEFYNTISNIPCILLAMVGLINSIKQRFEKRFSVLHLSTIALGIGSMLFHATLRHAQQQSDETRWCGFCNPSFPVPLVVGFQLHYIFLSLLCLPRMYKYYMHSKGTPARRLAQIYITTMILGGVCWLVDRCLCTSISSLSFNPQGHAWWHLLMGLNAYFANTFLQFCRAKQLNWSPELKYYVGLPFVKVSKPKPE